MVLLVVSDGWERRAADALASPEARVLVWLVDLALAALDAEGFLLVADEAFFVGVDEAAFMPVAADFLVAVDDFEAAVFERLEVDDDAFFFVADDADFVVLVSEVAFEVLPVRLEVDLLAAADRFDAAGFALDCFVLDDVRDDRCAAMRTTLLVDESQDFIAVAWQFNGFSTDRRRDRVVR